MRNVQTRAYGFLALAMIIAGSAVVAGKCMVAAMPVFLAAELGISVSLLILLPLSFLRRHGQPKLDGKTHVALFLQALCGIVLYRAFIFWGLRHTSAAAGGLISSAAPALIALLAFLLLRERMSGKRVASVLSVSIGILAVNLHPFLSGAVQASGAIKGNCLILMAVLCEACFSVMSRAGCGRVSALRGTALMSSYAFICLLPCALYEARGYDFAAMRLSTVLCIGYYGIFVSFLSSVFWFKGIAVVPAGVAAAFTGFVPLSGVLLSGMFLREEISGAHWLGLLFVLLGVGLACLPEAAPASRKAAATQSKI